MSILALEFMQHALLAAVVTGLAAPAVGTYLVQRRQALMGDTDELLWIEVHPGACHDTDGNPAAQALVGHRNDRRLCDRRICG